MTISSFGATPMFMLWKALLLPAVAPPSTALDGSTAVYAALRPLVGGPKLLPLHVQIANEGTLFDFLPANPTAADTTASLLSGAAVDGKIRCRPVRSLGRDPTWRLIGHTSRASSELLAFAEQQPRSLSLVSNNCWTFASNLASFAVDE